VRKKGVKVGMIDVKIFWYESSKDKEDLPNGIKKE
jgi:hypothetical protein